MTKRKQYSEAFRVKIIKLYLEGNHSFSQLAREYDITSRNTVREWYRLYKRFGFKGLKTKSTSHIYSREFKLSVLNYKQTHSLTNQAVADHFKLPSGGVISIWQNQYLSQGPDAFTLEIRRQAKDMSEDQRPKSNKKSDTEDPYAELEKVKRENELLRMELLYQKKLQTLAQQKKK